MASDTAKSTFISTVSHELRTPLFGILAGIELIQDTQLTAFQSEMALSVTLAGRTLLDTVDNILDYSKISNMAKDEKNSRARVELSRNKSANEKSNSGTRMIHVDIARLTEEVRRRQEDNLLQIRSETKKAADNAYRSLKAAYQLTDTRNPSCRIRERPHGQSRNRPQPDGPKTRVFRLHLTLTSERAGPLL